MSASFPNIYNRRKVAEASAKSCDICYKLSTSVLITPDQKDFFYVCTSHLKDPYFCTAQVDEAAQKAKRERELAQETERLKKEYEEKQRKKKENKEAQKEKGKDKDKDKDKDKKDGKERVTKDDETTVDSEQQPSDASAEEEPRVFELKPTFYQQRLQKKRQADAAKRDRERVSKPGYFPVVPNHDPGK